MANPENKPENERVGLIREGVPDVWIDIYDEKGDLRHLEVGEESIHGFDASGIELEVTQVRQFLTVLDKDRYCWRYKKDDGSWSSFFFTFHSPTERITDKDEDAPTVAEVIKAAEVKGSPQKDKSHYKFNYTRLWEIYGKK